jgi:hypothetical protein
MRKDPLPSTLGRGQSGRQQIGRRLTTLKVVHAISKDRSGTFWRVLVEALIRRSSDVSNW